MRTKNWIKRGGIILAIGASLMLLLEIIWILDPPDEMETRMTFRIIASLFGNSIAQSIISTSIFNLEFSWIALWLSQIHIPRTAIVLSFLLWASLIFIDGRNKNKFASISSFIFLTFLVLWLLAELFLPYSNYFSPLVQPIHWKYFFAFILADLSTLAIIAGMALIIFNSKIVGDVSISKLLFSFKGRVDRGMFWGVWLSIIIINFIVWNTYNSMTINNKVSLISLFILLVISILCIWIGMAIQVKRWHDRNKTGWMVLINLIPIIGFFWVVVELGFLRGTTGPNKYGEPQFEKIKKSLLLFLGFLCGEWLLSTFLHFNMQPLPYENYVFSLLNFIEVMLLIWVIIEVRFHESVKIHNKYGKSPMQNNKIDVEKMTK